MACGGTSKNINGYNMEIIIALVAALGFLGGLYITLKIGGIL